MTNDQIKTFRTLTIQELREFLESLRPDVSWESWQEADLVTVLLWILPAYAGHPNNELRQRGLRCVRPQRSQEL